MKTIEFFKDFVPFPPREDILCIMILIEIFLFLADGKYGDHHHPQQAASIMIPAMGVYLGPSTQLELVGHSIVISLSLSLCLSHACTHLIMSNLLLLGSCLRAEIRKHTMVNLLTSLCID
jgi:hypothetical protein